MLDHISIGVKDIDAARRFYDETLKPLGYKRLYDGATASGYGEKRPKFWILATDRPVPADAKSGLHISFEAPSRNGVDEFHREALTRGGRDNGKPGLRADYGPGYYAAFAVDPDGYRLEAHCNEKAA